MIDTIIKLGKNNIKTKIYRKKNNEVTDEYSRGRKFFVAEGISGSGQFIMTTGPFLAGYINLLGASDEVNGIIGIIPAIAGMFQIVTPIIFEKKEKRKKSIIRLAIFFRFCLACVYIVPMIFLPLGLSLKSFIIIFSFAYCLNAMLMPPLTNWLISITPIEIRGSYLAVKDKMSLLTTAILTIALSRVLDYTKTIGKPYLGFVVVSVFIFLFGILNVFSLTQVCEPKNKLKPTNYKFKDAITIPFQSHSFRILMGFFIIWNFSLQIGGPFITVYNVTHLKFSYTYMMSMSVIGSLTRVIFVSMWGRVADRKSWFTCIKRSILILGITHLMWGFVNTNNASILVPILNISGGFAWGGVAISLFNIQFLFSKAKGRTMYIGMNAAIGGIVSSLAAWCGGRIVTIFEGVTISLGKFSFNNMQLVFVISGTLMLLCPICIRLFMEKQPIEEQ